MFTFMQITTKNPTMKKLFNLTLAASAAALVTACGGGGGSGSGDNSTPVVVNSMSKYIGEYSYCDQDHTRTSIALTDAGGQSLNIAYSEVTYQNANCSGTILANYNWNNPGRVTYISTDVATVSAPGLPSSLSVDKVGLSVNTQATLSGPGASGNCVTYPRGNFCYDLIVQGQTNEGAFYLTGNTFYELLRSNGIYYSDGVYTKR